MRARILVVDDEPGIRALFSMFLSKQHDVATAASAEEGLARLRAEPADVLVTDLRMPGMDGLALVRRVVREMPGMPIVGTSGDAALPELAELLRLGIADFLVKPFTSDETAMAVQRALALRSLLREVPPPATDDAPALPQLLGQGALVTALREQAMAAAGSAAPLLIEGASGSGKTLIARGIHEVSDRRGEPLIELACGALPESLLEGELFGHAAGSFTGATKDRPGAFERCRGGTIVLDEVTALSPRAQARIVQVVTSRSITRVGEDRPRPIHARIIATTQRALEPLAAQGSFREDLLHALSVLRLRTPALCELPAQDLETLTRSLLSLTCARIGRPEPDLDASFLETAASLPWSGNVRELENALERAVLLGDGGSITEADLVTVSAQATQRRLMLPERGIDLVATLAAIEEDYVERALDWAQGNRQRAADLLGLTRTGLVQKLRRQESKA